jgi:hypothetical protein
VECVGDDIVFTNTGSGMIRITVLLMSPKSFPGSHLEAGESWNFRPLTFPWLQPDPVPRPVFYTVSFEDPDGSGIFYPLDGGSFGPCGTDTTVPPTTAPGPTTPVLAPMSGDSFVAPEAEIGPGEATFGATGFAAGEAVTVVLHSTPRELGTVTADANGLASITFELLASDGAGEHSVVFTGPSGTVTVPFTLVLPAQTLPPTR